MPSSLVGQVTRAGPHMDSFPIFVSHIHPLPPHSCGSIWTSGGYPVKDHSSITRLHPVANTENSGPCLMLPFHSWRTQDPEKHGSCTMTNPMCTQEQKESRMVPAALGTTCEVSVVKGIHGVLVPHVPVYCRLAQLGPLHFILLLSSFSNECSLIRYIRAAKKVSKSTFKGMRRRLPVFLLVRQQ